jgi:hypothetical protein
MKQVAGVYGFGGITLVSEIALPELTLVQHHGAKPHLVHIRLGEVPNRVPEAVEVDPDCFATPTYYWLRIHGIGCYLVTNGEEIIVSPDPWARPLDVRAYLLGTLFVALFQQRHLLPLHASAVSSRKGVVAFLARSGEGKSSLAAHLAQRGFSVLADDVCLIDSASTGPTMVIPTAPWLKLWRNSIEHLGKHVQGLERVFSEDDKYRLPLANTLHPEPIGRLVFLETDPNPNSSQGSANEIQELSAVEAIPLLMDLTHQAYVLQATGQMEQSFLRCSRVSSQARAYRLIRPWGLEHLESTVDAVEKLLLEP